MQGVKERYTKLDYVNYLPHMINRNIIIVDSIIINVLKLLLLVNGVVCHISATRRALDMRVKGSGFNPRPGPDI